MTGDVPLAGAVRADQEDVRVAGSAAFEGEPAAVRRERDHRVDPRRLRESQRRAPGRGDDIDLEVAGPIAVECEQTAVRRPGGVEVVARVVRHLDEAAAT